MKKPWRSRLAAGTFLIALAGAAWWGLREEPQQVDTATVAEAPMQVTFREEGRTRVKEVYAVSAPITGHLARTVIEEGDAVEAGKTVVAAIHPLDPPLIDRRVEAELLATRDAARSAVGIANSELRRAQATLELSEDQLARALKLSPSGVISESALQKVTNDVEIQKAAVEAARSTVSFRTAELASAEARLLQPDLAKTGDGHCCVTLYAPVDGTVLSVHARSEQPIAAGAVVAEIGDTSQLEVVVDLLTADAVRIGPRAKAEISGWGGDKVLQATVRKIDPSAFTKVSALGIEEQRVNAVLDLDESDHRLGHGFRVVVELAAWKSEAELQVPISALFRTAGLWKVFTLAEGRVHETEVTIGRMNDTSAQVLRGLSAGDAVVLHPTDTLSEGGLATSRDPQR